MLVQNITCDDAGRGGFAIGSEMSGGIRNVTYRNSRLGRGSQSRGINLKPSVGNFAFKMMNSVIKMMNFVFKMMNWKGAAATSLTSPLRISRRKVYHSASEGTARR